MDTAYFRRELLIDLGMSESNIPPILDTATFRRLLLEAASGSASGFVPREVEGKYRFTVDGKLELFNNDSGLYHEVIIVGPDGSATTAVEDGTP